MKEIERTFFESTKRFLEPILSERIMSFKGLIQGILVSIIGIIIVFLLKDITNSISSGNINMNLFYFLVGIIILNYFIIIFTRHWTYAVMWPGYRKYFYNKYIPKFTYLDNNEIEKFGTGKLIAMINRGIHSWVDLLTRLFVDVFPGLIFIILSFIFISIINFYYAFIVFILFLFIIMITYIYQKKGKLYRLKRREINIGIMGKFVKILMSKFEILQNNKVDEELIYINKSLKSVVKANYHIVNYNIITDILIRILVDGIKLLIIIIFGIGLWKNTINFGEFLSLMSIAYILEQILNRFTSTYIDFTKIIVDVEKLWDFFDNTSQIKGYDTGIDFEYKNGKIEIENLTYGYTKDKPVFKDFNLKLNGGKVTALVGNSGSGKSTLVKLIAGYISANKGNIIIDGQKLNKVSLKSYYKNIGYLTQEPSVFDGTILDNLTYAIDRDLKSGELDKVLKQAKCEFIYDLEKGVETEIGERGVRLSGGQKQRLAIAKIFLKDPKIIILDEPTSALDSFSEEQITYAMHNLFKGRTVIIIAHRLQTVKEADDIILFENGEIKERGNHKELVDLKGQYKKMLDLQSGF